MDASDGHTSKLVVQLQDGHRVETVIIRHLPSKRHLETGVLALPQLQGQEEEGKERPGGKGKARKPRTTICVSSQVGCQMGCKFCATGTMGIVANLTAGEILEQLIHVYEGGDTVRNVGECGTTDARGRRD